MKIKLIVFDVDGTLYSSNVLRILIFIEIFLYLLVFPYKFREIHYLWYFRKNRQHLSNLKSYNLSDKEYMNQNSKINLSSDSRKAIVEKWIMQKPLKYLKYLKYREITNFLDFLKNNKINYVFYSDYPISSKLNAMNIKYEKYYHANQETINVLKPNLKGIKIILSDFNIKSSECLIVGDRDDIDGILAKEAKTLFINYPKNKNMLKKQFLELNKKMN